MRWAKTQKPKAKSPGMRQLQCPLPLETTPCFFLSSWCTLQATTSSRFPWTCPLHHPSRRRRPLGPQDLRSQDPRPHRPTPLLHLPRPPNHRGLQSPHLDPRSLLWHPRHLPFLLLIHRLPVVRRQETTSCFQVIIRHWPSICWIVGWQSNEENESNKALVGHKMPDLGLHNEKGCPFCMRATTQSHEHVPQAT